MMRAACNILAAVAVVGGTLPAYGTAFWQQHKAAPPPAQQLVGTRRGSCGQQPDGAVASARLRTVMPKHA